MTSELAFNKREADDFLGASGSWQSTRNAANCFVIKIVSSNSRAFKILQGTFANLAASKAFKGCGGVPRKANDFPPTKLSNTRRFRAFLQIYFWVSWRRRSAALSGVMSRCGVPSISNPTMNFRIVAERKSGGKKCAWKCHSGCSTPSLGD